VHVVEGNCVPQATEEIFSPPGFVVFSKKYTTANLPQWGFSAKGPRRIFVGLWGGTSFCRRAGVGSKATQLSVFKKPWRRGGNWGGRAGAGGGNPVRAVVFFLCPQSPALRGKSEGVLCAPGGPELGLFSSTLKRPRAHEARGGDGGS